MQNFIADIIDADLASGRHTTVTTRFPPEPNGYLHIGHAKSICLNFGLARKYGGKCHLRFDDTNPTTEKPEYVASIQRDVRWLGFDWGEHLYFASDYYERLYQHAVELIERGLAYVCELSEQDVRAYRGTVTEPGKNSPYRDRDVAENLALFQRMRDGELDEGAAVLRAKIDMASPNMKLRDPPIYRIKKAHHYRTGDAWCVYPLYDFTHALSDAYERITHSICTLEFENNRELYDWVVNNVTLDCEPLPRQHEFARLNLSYTLMSKRKLLQLVNEGHVSGWDDPRMPTIAGLRRRGITPEAIRAFCDMIGVAKANSTVDVGKLEYCIRDDLNQRAPRVMCVLRPLRVVIDDFPEGRTDTLTAPFFPADVGKPGAREVPFTRELFIEETDFMKTPARSFHRLSPGAAVRLRYAHVIRCDEVIEDDAGRVIELRCSRLDDEGEAKVKGTIHWVSAEHGVPCTVRLYDRLFDAEAPTELSELNPTSLIELTTAVIEPAAARGEAGERMQFERQGYFCTDSVDSRPDALVFNRTVTLRDTWAKLQQKTPKSAPDRAAARPLEPTASRPKGKSPKRDEPLSAAVQARVSGYVAKGVADADARRLAQNEAAAALFDATLEHSERAAAIARWIVNEVARQPSFELSGAALADLVELVEAGTITATAGKDVLGEMLASGGSAAAIVSRRGLEQLGTEDALAPVVAKVLAENPEPVERYRAGNKKLLGFFVGQVMRATSGRADAALVNRLLSRELDG